MSKYKTTGKQTLFDAENTIQKLSEIGNPLEKLDSVIDFEMYRNALENAFENKANKNHAEAKPYDVVVMFQVMTIKHYYNLGDNQVQASLCNAKDLAMRSKGNYNDWRNVMRYQLMIVDDLGTGPREVMEFRMSIHH